MPRRGGSHYAQLLITHAQRFITHQHTPITLCTHQTATTFWPTNSVPLVAPEALRTDGRNTDRLVLQQCWRSDRLCSLTHSVLHSQYDTLGINAPSSPSVLPIPLLHSVHADTNPPFRTPVLSEASNPPRIHNFLCTLLKLTAVPSMYSAH